MNGLNHVIFRYPFGFWYYGTRDEDPVRVNRLARTAGTEKPFLSNQVNRFFGELVICI